MALIVQKFGGSSVKDRNRIFNVARIVANTHKAGNDVVVVVSAQGDTTDDLIAKAAEITHNPSAREMDMLLASGEQISISLLAMALNELGCHAISLTGWQAGFRTDRAYTKARITRLETERISSELERNRVVVVAGFQGLNKMDDITTLGRGGSDTSAVAIAAALHADRCQIFTDVEGVYTADPRKVRNTRKLDEITFDEMLELASLGAQVLNNRSVELAKKYNVELEVLSSLNPVPGTVVKEVTKDMEGMLIKGVAKDTDVAVITILNVPDEPGMSFKIFGLLAQKNINVDIILQSTGRDGIPLLLASLDKPHGILAKEELEKIPLLNRWMKLLGCVFVQRDDLRASVRALNDATAIVESGKSFVIFPEGTRYKGEEGGAGEFKAGAFRIAVKTGAPVVPVAITGARALFENNGNLCHPGSVHIKVLPPIRTAGMSKAEQKQLPDAVRQAILAQL